jgi:signal transduction histidine kinase
MDPRPRSRLASALRSWRREEQSLAPLSAAQRIGRALLLATILAGAGLALHGLVLHQERSRRAEQREALSILRAQLQASRQTAPDWARRSALNSTAAPGPAATEDPVAGIRQADLFMPGGMPLLITASVLGMGIALGLTGRMLWMLERRRQRLEQRRQTLSRRAQQHRQQAQQQHQLMEQKLTSSLTAAVVAHEIQQPLSTILLQCRLALQDLESAGSDRHPGAAPAAITDRAQLVSRLQALSAEATRAVEITETMRMLLRNVNTPHTTLRLNDVVESSLLFFKRAIQNHHIRLEVEGLEHQATIAGDATQVQSAINNLIQNAIEAMAASPDPGTPTLRITLDTISADPSVNGDPAGDPHGPIVRLRLADSGPGFQQSDAGLPLASRKPNGSGLGLFVVRTTMRNHGGALRIGRSTELGGAEVELLWPASPATAAALSSPAAG